MAVIQARVRWVEIRIDQDRMLQEVERELARLIRVERLAMLVERRTGEIPRRCLGRMSCLPSMLLPLLSQAVVITFEDFKKSEGMRKNFEAKE